MNLKTAEKIIDELTKDKKKLRTKEYENIYYYNKNEERRA